MYIDKKDVTVLISLEDEIFDFKEGFARYKFNNKYGFINKTGKKISNINYDYADDFYNGFAAVKKDGT